MCCIRVYHGNALLIPIQICTVSLYIYLYSLYFFLYGFLKTQPGAVSTACAPLWPLVRLLLLQTVLILNKCTTFVPR